MLTVTKKAAALLKAAKAAKGAAGRCRNPVSNRCDAQRVRNRGRGRNPPTTPILPMRNSSSRGFAFFVEDALIEPLDGRTLRCSRR